MTFALPLRNVAALDSFVMQVSDPSSPTYRHFLTPQQVQSEFLPTTAYNSLLSYLQASGFHIVMTALDSELVVEGTAGQFQSAFGTGISTFTNGTYSYYASTGASTFEGAYLYASNATLLLTKPASIGTRTPYSNVTFTSETFSAKQLQPVYNATYFYSHGETGEGQTIGLLDFYGSPTIGSDLAQFDRTFGFPDTTLNIVPVGPYDPSLGATVGWSSEISLDVEASHAMAPGAVIDLYVANGALPLSVPLAKIVQDDKVTTLSQSFGNPEWQYSITSFLGGPSYVALNALIPDQYYALGSAEGITFTASTGDGGGSGYSSGPEGNLEYPATSPFVTAVGGTQTYFSTTASGSPTFTQTAWSNVGFVPNLVNQGGGGGGVSILEPKPWYQTSQATPPSFPNGRMNPDLSLQAGVDPATLIVDSGHVTGIGGTSESSPLLAGLLTLVAQSLKGHLGLINPFLYKIGNDSSEYQKGFSPVTFGYIIPWRASFGYNLATGWGAPNLGGLGVLLNSTRSKPSLSIDGEIINGTGMGQLEFTAGQNLTITARITEGGGIVGEGSFQVTLETLQATTSPTPMKYDPITGNWTATISIGQESGFASVLLTGRSGDGVPGSAMGTTFVGYLGSLTVTNNPYSLSVDPWTWSSKSPLSLTVVTTDLRGHPQPMGSVPLTVEQYSMPDNSYSNSSSVVLEDKGSGSATGSLSTPARDGPISLVLQGDTYGYAPAVYGIYLQTSYVYPGVAAEPGSTAPGQALTIITTPIAPVNVYFETSLETGRSFAYDVSVGSNVTATLVSPSGVQVSNATLAYQSCAQALRVCNGGADVIYGQLPVPSGIASGLYNVMLNASYRSLTAGGNITGSFYGQVWVSGQMIDPSITIAPGSEHVSPDFTIGPSSIGQSGELFQGEPAHVVARIAYQNGTPVTFGEYSAVVYPSSLAGQYTTLMHDEYEAGKLVQLSYDSGLQAWVGNVTLPSSSSEGSISGLNINSFDYSGPYDIYVTGLSADGTPTSSSLTAQQPFFIQPYVYTSGNLSSIPLGSHLAFDNSSIAASGSLSGDLFIGSNSITGANVTITDSEVQGSLGIASANVTLVGVSGGEYSVTGSRLTLKDSSAGSLTLVNSTVTLSDSSYGTVNPALPSISVRGLPQIFSGDLQITANVTGMGLAQRSFSATIDNGGSIPVKVNSTSDGLAALVDINAASLVDGVHTLTIQATQSDGLSSSYSASFSTNAHQLSLQNQTAVLLDLVYLLVAIAVVALVLAIIALLRSRRRMLNPVPPAAPHV
jgi:subtilase family serine protease